MKMKVEMIDSVDKPYRFVRFTYNDGSTIDVVGDKDVAKFRFDKGKWLHEAEFFTHIGTSLFKYGSAATIMKKCKCDLYSLTATKFKDE